MRGRMQLIFVKRRKKYRHFGKFYEIKFINLKKIDISIIGVVLLAQRWLWKPKRKQNYSIHIS